VQEDTCAWKMLRAGGPWLLLVVGLHLAVPAWPAWAQGRILYQKESLYHASHQTSVYPWVVPGSATSQAGRLPVLWNLSIPCCLSIDSASPSVSMSLFRSSRWGCTR